MIKISPRKIFKIPFGEGDDSFTITWQFPYSVDDKFKKLRAEERNEGFDAHMVSCIVGWDGIIDSETDAPVPVNDENKKAVYDLVRLDPQYMLEVTVAGLGAAGKNSKAGAMLQSILNGQSTNAPTASESVEQPSPASI